MAKKVKTVELGACFGRWTVIDHPTKRPHVGIECIAQCDCGNVRLIPQHSLTSSNSRSCGCLKLEMLTTHGHTKGDKQSPEFSVWRSMIKRCTVPTTVQFHRYGGRGISICERWMLFKNFLADMGPRVAGTSIDRINNDGNYEPANCRWATFEEQVNNTVTNRFIEHDGLRLSIAQWARRLGVKESMIRGRLERGWSEVDALEKPRCR